MRLRRVYFRCASCAHGGFALDERLGLLGRYSPQAQRLICLAGGSWSFDVAATRLAELTGLRVCDTTIRAVCQTHGAAMSAWQRTDPAARQPFRQADGDVEFTTDGTMVNTTQGWREMRVGIVSKRRRGPAATAAQWDTRPLPPPHARLAFAAIEDSDRFGRRWGQWAARLGICRPAEIHLLADGASWIWEELRKNLIGATGTLDVFHAFEHVSDAAKTVLGEGTSAAREWTAAARRALLESGFDGLQAHTAATRSGGLSPAAERALTGLENYLGKHVDHLNYRERLAAGQSIGSGQVEGACKHLVGRRLKQTGARWRIRRVNRMAGLCCLVYSHHWNTYWDSHGYTLAA